MPDLDPILITIDGRRFWRDPADGRTVPYIAGGSEDADTGAGSGDDAGTGTDPGKGDAGTDAGKTFTQADLDRLAGKRAAEAARKAKADIDAYLKSEKDAADLAAMDDVARAKAEADTARAEAASIRAEAAAERLAAKVERWLLAEGVAESALTRATRLLALAPDASDDDIAAEIDAVKADVPGLFTPATGTGKPNPPRPATGTPPPPPKGGQPPADPTTEAHAELRRMGLEPRKTAA